MVDMIRHPSISADLEEAERLREQDDLEAAIERVAIAFYRFLERHKKRNTLLSGLKWPILSPKPSTYKFGGSPGRSRLDDHSKKMFDNILEQTDALKKAVEPMQDAMVALALGVDYGRYQTFLELTPPVNMMLPKNEERVPRSGLIPTPMYHPRRPHYITPDSYRFCFDFVIEAVTRSQSDAGSLQGSTTLRLG